MISRSSVAAAFAAVILASGCGGKTAQNGALQTTASQTTSGGDAASASVCARPPGIGDPDASVGQCTTAAYYLNCQGSAGGGELCASNDPTQCPGTDAIVGETYSDCRDLCNGDEYAVTCGGPGLGPDPTFPSGCRALPSGPGGGSVGCCPCGFEANTFACGTSTCDAASQVCEHVEGGAPPGVDYLQCIAIPTQCTNDVSCACVDSALQGRGADGCTQTGSGLTVLIAVP